MSFPGFQEQPISYIHIPEPFFHQVLLEIDDLDELKLTLYVFWRIDRMESSFRYLRFSDLMKDSQLVASMAGDAHALLITLSDALQKAVSRGTLLQAEVPGESAMERIICLNSPKGRALVDAIQRGEWKLPESAGIPTGAYPERPNIFQLYEANIGPLTPMIADNLRDAEQTYQASWIEDAFQIAVERNKRSWHYIEAILRRWQEGGRDDRKEKQDRRDTEETRRRYKEWEN